DGYRESLGLDVVTSEDGAVWLAFLRSLVARGLAGVKLVSSDAHPGLVDAIAATLQGACWQRCRTHFARNLLTRVPTSAGLRRDDGALDLRPARRRVGARAARPRGRPARGALPRGGGAARRGRSRGARLHQLPQGALAPALVDG